MPVGTDEIALNIDGFVSVDPEKELRQRFLDFIASRTWTTDQIFYGDQSEPVDEETEVCDGDERLAWSITVVLGLDHLKSTETDWRADIDALLSFIQTIQSELENEFVVEVCYRSALWYSQHITLIDERTTELTIACNMIERATKIRPKLSGPSPKKRVFFWDFLKSILRLS